MAKLIVIGIDSMDAGLLSCFESDMPNFRRLREQSPDLKLRSVYPPDSATCWASIYTGLNPAKHGVITFIDPLDKVSQLVNIDIDTTTLRGRTFWDIAGKAGKKVCILFPHLGYPVWQVNGVMVGRTNLWDIKNFPVQTFPPSLSQQKDLSHLNTLKGYPSRKHFKEYIKNLQSLLLAEADFGLEMLQKDSWDLFFIYSSALDWVEHNLWMYFDENDPTYPGSNPYKEVIPYFHKLCDEFVGKFLAIAGDDTMVMVLSDHGHGMRPIKIVNINEILRQKGFLVPRMKDSSYGDPYYLIEKLKGRLSHFVNKYGVGTLALKVMQAFPWWRKLYTSPLSIDWDRTTAYVSDLSGIKAYTYGGVMVRRENIKDSEYEDLRDLLIKELSVIAEPSTGDNLVRWVCRREDLYSGEYIGKYPDIIFNLKDSFGAGWEVHSPLITECRTHNIQPGSHKAEFPVLFLVNLTNKQSLRKDITLMDIAPSILKILGVTTNATFDGRDIFTDL